MIRIGHLLSKIFCRKAALSMLEKSILDRVHDHLSMEIRLLWKKQIEAINKIQRVADGVEVDFYRIKNGQPTFDENLTFPNKSNELLVAEITISYPTLGTKTKACVWSVRGFLFSIEYEKSPKILESAFLNKNEDAIMVNCKLMADLEKDVR